MTDLEQTDPANNKSRKKNNYSLVVLLEVGSIVILGILIFNALFPTAYWQSRELEQNLAKQSRELEQNRAKWESQHITHYRMSLDLPFSSSTYSRMPLTVEVRDDKIVSVMDINGRGFSPEIDEDFHYDYPQAFTIPGLFTIANDWFRKKPPSINVSYDPILGYPTSISIDPWTEPCCQEMDYSVRVFQVLPP